MPCMSHNIVVNHVVIFYDTHIIVHVWPFCIEEAQTSHFHVLTYIELGHFFFFEWMFLEEELKVQQLFSFCLFMVNCKRSFKSSCIV
jgi:hypothetical protein